MVNSTNYLGTHFDRSSDGFVTLTQLQIVSRVLNIVGLNKDGNVKNAR